MKTNKYKVSIIILVIVIINIPLNIFAHSGRTDGSGGHYVGGTGEYHYHHGYSAHQHIDGVCPYDYDDKTNSEILSGEKVEVVEKNDSNDGSKNNTKIVNKKENNFLKIIMEIFILFWWAIIPIGYWMFDFIKQRINNNTNIESKEIEEKNKNIAANSISYNKYRCPKCGGSLVIRTGRYGKFLGCRNYPRCKYTKNINKR